MSFVKIWVHVVFSTKNRNQQLTKEIRYEVQKHIIENCKENEIFLQAINGHTEHLHCLISLGKEQTIAIARASTDSEDIRQNLQTQKFEVAHVNNMVIL